MGECMAEMSGKSFRRNDMSLDLTENAELSRGWSGMGESGGREGSSQSFIETAKLALSL